MVAKPILILTALLSVSALTACGGAAEPSTGSAPASTGPAAQSSAGTGAAPGVSGLVAALEGTTMQVQGNDEQTAVKWTSSTTFTTEAAGTLSDVAVGTCVQVSSAQDAASSTSGTSPTTVVASRVSIQPASQGATCTGGFGRGGGGSGRPSGMPSGGPSAGASGAPGGGREFGGGFGTVKSVEADSFTVESIRPAMSRGDGSSSPSSEAETTTTVTFKVTSETAYTKQVNATGASAKVGTCVSALGQTDDTGALAATSVSVSQAVDGQCAVMGRGGPRG